jgi:hypothetical protein
MYEDQMGGDLVIDVCIYGKRESEVRLASSSFPFLLCVCLFCMLAFHAPKLKSFLAAILAHAPCCLVKHRVFFFSPNIFPKNNEHVPATGPSILIEGYSANCEVR